MLRWIPGVFITPGTYHFSKFGTVKKIINNFNGKINKFTINNVVIFKKLKCINLIRENRNIQFGLEVFKNKLFFFDNRFLVLSKFNGKLVSNNNHLNILHVMSKILKN